MPQLPPRIQEDLLMQHTSQRPFDRALCTTVGRGQLAVQWSEQGQVDLWTGDLYHEQLLSNDLPDTPTLQLSCHTDFPDSQYDLIGLPFSVRGEAELTRDLLQQAVRRLADKGTIVASTDNPNDRWLGDELSRLFRRVSCQRLTAGAVYEVQRSSLRANWKCKNFDTTFRFRDGDNLLEVFSRPGVFSHRRLDTGARRLIQHMTLPTGARVLDIGCGSGAVALSAASREQACQVHAIDSNVRAIQCATNSAERNQLSNLTTEATWNGPQDEAERRYDVVLANPPYYANNQIAMLFAEIAEHWLVPGGQALFVTKTPDWYGEHLPAAFVDVSIQQTSGYAIVRTIIAEEDM